MKVAAITITFNDDFQLDNWIKWYNEYKEDLFLHVIVDNHSDRNYVEKLKKSFPYSHIIERNSNGGTTAAYNDGIRYVLSIKEVDAIMLLAMDIRLASNCIKVLYDYLHSDNSLGMVSSPLLVGETGIVYTSGLRLSALGEGKGLCMHQQYDEIKNRTNYVDYVQGGYNMSKRSFYEKVGLQDETMFMYGDELDMCLRSKKEGFKQGITSYTYAEDHDVVCPTPKYRLSRAYLIARNHVYLHRKHYSSFNAFCYAVYLIYKGMLIYVKHFRSKDANFTLRKRFQGLIDGWKGNMDNSQKEKFYYSI